MISDSYENKAMVLVLIRCVKLYFQCKRCLLGLIMNDFFFSNGVFWMKIILIIILFLSLKRTLPNPEYRQLRNYQFLSYRFSAVSNFMKVCKGGNLPSITAIETWRESQLKNFLPSAIFSMCSEHETCLSFSFLSFSISLVYLHSATHTYYQWEELQ